jgi:hypothetical protein
MSNRVELFSRSLLFFNDFCYQPRLDKMKKETGFDPDFFEENINASFTGVCRAITSIDCPAIFHWSHQAQHERWAHLISEISG